jgi:polyhydroxybutyrate depolymerase
MIRKFISYGWLMWPGLLVGAGPLVEREWVVDGVVRRALIAEPEAKAGQAGPLVFAFHGHGGTMQSAARSFPIRDFWPEALVVYPQGLKTPGKLTDPEGERPGWQHGAEDQGGRDLNFFDVVLAAMKVEYEVDESRIYSTGHSNGGGFTFLLWAERGEVFAAVAPSGASGGRSLRGVKPKPVLHIAGEADELVKYAWQVMTMDFLRKLNGCGEGVAWELDKNCTYYPSAGGTPVVTAIHPGGHGFPKQAPEVIVKFFKQHVKPKRSP